MDQEEVFRDQLAEEKAADNKTEAQPTADQLASLSRSGSKAGKKAGALRKLLKNPIVQLSIPFLGEAGSGGILPCWTGYVIYTYSKQKKDGANPNIAEYFIVGGLAGTVDIIGLFGLTGVLLIFSYAVSLPFVILLWIWKITKRGVKSAAPVKAKK